MNKSVKKYKLPISKVTSFSFKDYYYESLLLESPNIIQDLYNYMDDYQFNKDHTLTEILPNFTFDGHYNINSVGSLGILKHVDGNNVELYFTEKNGGDIITVAIYEFYQHDGFIENKYIWNDKRRGIGLIRYLFNNYMLPKYKCIVSDSDISRSAQNFWESILTEYSNKEGFNFFILDWNSKQRIIENIKYTDELPDDVYADELPDDVYETGNLRLGIEKLK